MSDAPNAEPSIRILVVDDHDLLREGVSSVLASYPGIEVVGEARNGETAIAEVSRLEPDVVIMDLVMPGLGGVEAIRRLRANHQELGIVALSSFWDGQRVREVIDAGANGYLIKSVDGVSLAQAVRDAAQGLAAFSPEVTLALIKNDGDTQVASLTLRESEIADQLALGKTNAEIAEALVLSIFTVKNHVSSILMKLNVRTRTEAAAVLFSQRQ